MMQLTTTYNKTQENHKSFSILFYLHTNNVLIKINDFFPKNSNVSEKVLVNYL